MRARRSAHSNVIDADALQKRIIMQSVRSVLLPDRQSDSNQHNLRCDVFIRVGHEYSLDSQSRTTVRHVCGCAADMRVV